MPPADSYSVELSGNFNYSIKFELVRTDLEPLTTPTDLTWNTEYTRIDTQKHSAIQFSMKLSGAVDRDGDDENSQQLIVPIVIDMPIPAGINPGFLVILHKLSSGVIEQIRPHIYWNDNGECHARFVVSSFSDFALVEYSFGFGTDALTKYTDSEPFTLKASGNAEGSTVRYESSAPEVAGVDENGLVTIEKDKFSALEDLKVS